jgi:hypothetical protein
LVRGSVFAAPQRDQTIRVFLPAVYLSPQTAVSDLQIVHLGLYQSVQNQSNGVTLIAHKPALLRVYAQTAQPGVSATVTIEARRDGRLLGALTEGPHPVATQPMADVMDSTFNFDLPDDWLEGRVTLTATIDQANDLAEPDETNNATVSTFQFHSVPTLELTIVPVTYVDAITGVTFSQPAHDPISSWLLAAFPLSDIQVTIREPMTFGGDLRQATEWGRLLDQLTALAAAEVGPSSAHLYIGLVPNSDGSGQGWFDGGVSGFGWLNQRVAVVLDVGDETGESAGHEIGHNFGRRHAPCGNPSSVDPQFPYPNALIGVYGVDTSDETLLAPDQTHDMMSYCGPEWVSDYTYEGLLQNQLALVSQSAPSGDGLFIQAAMDGEAISSVAVSRINQPFRATSRTSDYRVRLVDERGATIGDYPAMLYEAEEHGVSLRRIVAHVPAPHVRVGKVQLLQGATVIGEREP